MSGGNTEEKPEYQKRLTAAIHRFINFFRQNISSKANFYLYSNVKTDFTTSKTENLKRIDP